MKHHTLKCFPSRFNAIWEKQCVADTRDNTDRNFKVGDIITYVEGVQNVDAFEKTGRCINAKVTWVDTFGVSAPYVTLSIQDVGLMLIDGATDDN